MSKRRLSSRKIDDKTPLKGGKHDPCILLLIDENVPNSVAAYLRERGHEVRLVRDLFPAGTPDPIIATMGDQTSAVVVTWDRDFRKLVTRIPDGNRARFRRLGRISFQCNETRGVALLEKNIDFIELAYTKALEQSDFRMIVTLQESGIKIQ